MIIGAIARACKILNLLGDQPDGAPLGVVAIANRLELHPATCSNILRTLVACGFVAQEAPRSGYVLGPAAYRVVRHGPWRKDLALLAGSLVTELAHRLREPTVLVALHRRHKVILHVADGNPDFHWSRQRLDQDDVYETATGRILLAYLAPEELEAVVSERGLPGDLWPEVQTAEDLNSELARVREAGHAAALSGGRYMQLAVPVEEEGRVVAALGLAAIGRGADRTEDGEIIRQMVECAGAIAARLEAADSDT